MKHILTMIVTIILLFLSASECNAKRGCSLYGHSCFGGHGKRSQTDGHFLDKASNVMNDASKEYPVYLNTIPSGLDFKGNNIPIPERDWKYTVYALLHQIINEAKNQQQMNTAVLSPSSPPDRYDTENM